MKWNANTNCQRLNECILFLSRTPFLFIYIIFLLYEADVSACSTSTMFHKNFQTELITIEKLNICRCSWDAHFINIIRRNFDDMASSDFDNRTRYQNHQGTHVGCKYLWRVCIAANLLHWYYLLGNRTQIKWKIYISISFIGLQRASLINFKEVNFMRLEATVCIFSMLVDTAMKDNGHCTCR